MLLLSLTTGCQQSNSSRLVGEWEGRPDSAAAAAERDEKLKKKSDADANPSEEEPEDRHADSSEPTLLEGIDVAVALTFERDGTAAMELEGEGESLAGRWRVVADLPPNGAEIEISQIEGDAKEKKVTEKRRFLIEFQPDGDTPGFTLREKGADPKFGRLYFTKRVE